MYTYTVDENYNITGKIDTHTDNINYQITKINIIKCTNQRRIIMKYITIPIVFNNGRNYDFK